MLSDQMSHYKSKCIFRDSSNFSPIAYDLGYHINLKHFFYCFGYLLLEYNVEFINLIVPSAKIIIAFKDICYLILPM